MNPPVGLASYVLVAVIVTHVALAVMEVLTDRMPWASIVAACLTAVLGVLRVYQTRGGDR